MKIQSSCLISVMSRNRRHSYKWRNPAQEVTVWRIFGLLIFELRVPDSEKPNWQLEIRGEAAPIWNKECLIECKKQDKRKILKNARKWRVFGRGRKTKKFN